MISREGAKPRRTQVPSPSPILPSPACGRGAGERGLAGIRA